MNLAQIISHKASQYPDKLAIAFISKGTHRNWTYRDLDQQMRQYVAQLKNLGIEKGDRVALQMPKSVEFLAFHFAVLAIDAIALPLNPDYRTNELSYFLTDSASKLLITTGNIWANHQAEITIPNLQVLLIDLDNPDNQVLLEQESKNLDDQSIAIQEVQEHDIAMICYTSGTTGRSKGAMISHQNLLTNIQSLHQAWQWSDRDVLLHVLPLFHVHGLNVAALGCLYAGATMIMIEKFEAQRVGELLDSSQITILMAVPTIYQRLINTWESLTVKPKLDTMRIFVSGSAPLSDQQFHQFEQITGHKIIERYGMTETGMNTSNPIQASQRKAKSVGFPLAGVEVKIVNPEGEDVAASSVGEVWIRGQNVFRGYWQMPAKTAESFTDGWFRTGDLGFQDPEDNYRLYLVGRAKELIITGGFNVYPKEIENVLETHPLVKEAAVIGIADRDFGEKVVAAIALKESIAQDINLSAIADELIQHCRANLISYKCPKQIFFVTELPRNAMGKLQKHLLAEILATRL